MQHDYEIRMDIKKIRQDMHVSVEFDRLYSINNSVTFPRYMHAQMTWSEPYQWQRHWLCRSLDHTFSRPDNYLDWMRLSALLFASNLKILPGLAFVHYERIWRHILQSLKKSHWKPMEMTIFILSSNFWTLKKFLELDYYCGKDFTVRGISIDRIFRSEWNG